MFSSSSNIAEQVNSAFLIFLLISVILLVLITFLMVYFVLKYNRRKHTTASETEGNTLLEIVWTVIPTILVMGMFYFGWIGYRVMKEFPEDAINVKVYGRMWSWLFQYENGVQSDMLKLPVGKPAKLLVISSDVLHSFYVPAFRVKQDAVPGMENYVWFTPSDTGLYDVFCAEYCGNRHSYMYSNVKVMPEKEFANWLASEGELVKQEAVAEAAGEATRDTGRLLRRGRKLVKTKGCIACHSLDGTEKVGPTFKGLFGRSTEVLTKGSEGEIIADEEYIIKAILEPEAALVKGYKPLMPSQKNLLTEAELAAIVEYLKSLE